MDEGRREQDGGMVKETLSDDVLLQLTGRPSCDHFKHLHLDIHTGIHLI